MARTIVVLVAAVLVAPRVSAVRAVEAETANPIRKVVTLLQTMSGKVQKEGEKEKELYEKFMCYCKNGATDLSSAISDSSASVPSIQSDIEEDSANSAKLKQDLKRHQVDRSAAETAMAEATALREKEHASFVAEATELGGYATALAGAIPAIQAGMAGTGLLQARAAQVAQLRHAVTKDDQLTDYDRQSVLVFLAGSTQGTSSRYVPKGGEIVGILKDMKEGFDTDLAGVEKKETEAASIFKELLSAKKKEVSTLTGSIEKKTARVGELDLSIVRMKQELTDSEEALIANQQFLQDLDSDCKSKTAEMELRVKTRGEELVAIADTIKILNDDDALELFKKALPSSASFVQLEIKKEAKQRAMMVLRKVEQASPKDSGADLRFLELALMGRKVDFSKVFKMIDDMVVILKQEQVDDDAKQEYCNMQLDTTKDKAKGLTKNIKDLEVDIDEKTLAVSALKEDLKVLNKGITELDRLVADATQQRKQENEEFTELISNDMAAKELLAFAKNRLQKFYNPKLYKPPPKAETADEEFLQITSRHGKQDPGPPPATFGKGYEKKGESSGGVTQMIDLLVRDLDKEMTEAEKQEELAQKAYEELMNDSAEKRAKDVKSVQVKESAKADSEELKTAAEGDLKAKKQEFMAVETYISQLHAECDWLLQNFDLRKSARAEEMDALKQAKAVLAGANFSFLQGKSLRR
jgi:hypothetical protein